MNCWIWIILLWCFCGNGGSCGGCMCDNGRSNENSNCFPTPVVPPCQPRGGDCGCNSGCNNDMIQPRGFAGFGDGNTCGCEEKKD